MVKYFTDLEFSRLIGVPVRQLAGFKDLHRCPQGYAEQELRRWVHQNGIPIATDWKDVVAIGDGGDGPVVWAEDLFEALFKCSAKTKALVAPASVYSEELWHSVVARMPGLLLVIWGGNPDVMQYHIHTSGQEEAIELACQIP